MPQVWNEACLREHPYRALLSGVDHNGLARATADEKRHDTVVARVCAVHHALLAVDEHHASLIVPLRLLVPGHDGSFARGCDS
jgi:hypothetical protein